MHKSITKVHCISHSVEISFVRRAPAMLPLALNGQILHPRGALVIQTVGPYLENLVGHIPSKLSLMVTSQWIKIAFSFPYFDWNSVAVFAPSSSSISRIQT